VPEEVSYKPIHDSHKVICDPVAPTFKVLSNCAEESAKRPPLSIPIFHVHRDVNEKLTQRSAKTVYGLKDRAVVDDDIGLPCRSGRDKVDRIRREVRVREIAASVPCGRPLETIYIKRTSSKKSKFYATEMTVRKRIIYERKNKVRTMS
jgi:hypothetical protein